MSKNNRFKFLASIKNLFTHDCKENRHRFKPRYDIEPPSDFNMNAFSGTAEQFKELLAPLTKRTYVCDVCKYCGKKIVRK